MGSVGENQTYGQSSNGYNAEKWDNFRVSERLDAVERAINNAEGINAYNRFNTALRNAQKQLDNATDYFDRNPRPDVMSKNQVQEQQELARRIGRLSDRIRQVRKNFRPE